MFRCAGSWVTLSAFPPAEFVQSDLLKSTFSTLVSLILVIIRGFVNIYMYSRTHNRDFDTLRRAATTATLAVRTRLTTFFTSQASNRFKISLCGNRVFSIYMYMS